MQPDNRDLNKTFSTASPHAYLQGYAETLGSSLKEVSADSLERAARVMFMARAKQLRIFVAGNGGSASISQHLECDFRKGCHMPGEKNLDVYCLSSNMAVVTAIGNDCGYHNVFLKQLEMADIKLREVLILISSSGNSPNILAAAAYGLKKGMTVIGLTGFDGGRLRHLCGIPLHVPFHNYGIVEDAHQAIMHILAQYHHAISVLKLSPSPAEPL